MSNDKQPSSGLVHRHHVAEVLTLRSDCNSFNFLRLALAGLVILSHTIPLGGFGNEIILGNQTLGDVSVDGFFAISGYLICNSVLRNVGRHGRKRGLIKYFWDRALRIFPAFWACLVITAGVFGPIGWLALHHQFAAYWSQPLGPLHYVTHDFFLRTNVFAIAGTPAQVPYPLVWDGSLWTLLWEFLCYTGIGVLAVIGLLSHRRLAVALTATTWLIEMYAFFTPTFWPNAQFALRFAVIFLTGALAFLYRDVLVDSGRLAIALLASACLGFMIGHPLSRVSGLVTGPALVYPILWLAAHLPF